MCHTNATETHPGIVRTHVSWVVVCHCDSFGDFPKLSKAAGGGGTPKEKARCWCQAPLIAATIFLRVCSAFLHSWMICGACFAQGPQRHWLCGSVGLARWWRGDANSGTMCHSIFAVCLQSLLQGGLCILGFFLIRFIDNYIYIVVFIPAFLLFLLLCFSAFPLFLRLFFFFACLPCLLFLLFCLFAFPASLLFCFSLFFFFAFPFFAFHASLLFCSFASVPFYFFFFCSHAFLLLCFFLLRCFFASFLYCLFAFPFLLLYSLLFVSLMKP